MLVPKAGELVVRDLRELAVGRLAAAPLRFLERHRHGDLLRRTTAEVAEITEFVRTQAPGLIDALLTLVLTGIVLVVYSPVLTGVLLVVAAPGAILTVRWFLRDAPAAFGRAAAAEGTVAAGFAETLTMAETLRENGGGGYWLRRRSQENAAAVRAARRVGVVELRINGVTLVEGVTLAAMLAAGAWAAMAGWVSVGTVVVFALAARTVVTGFVDLSQQAGELQATRTALARLLDLLSATEGPSAREPATGGDRPGPAPAQAPGLQVQLTPDRARASGPGRRRPESGGLRLEQVWFGYGGSADRPVLRGAELSAAPGERIGLVGRTGAGKSTLAKLLTGLYRPDHGRITVHGADVGHPPGDTARRRVVLVPQNVHLVGGTVADNLTILPGRPGRPDIERAARAAGLAEWLAGLPAGLDTPVGQRGGALSAGERQLVGLLRATLVDPDLLVLDEATADVDPETARTLERAVTTGRPDRIVIVIAHRPATIDALPRIVELADGLLRERAPGSSPVPTPEQRGRP